MERRVGARFSVRKKKVGVRPRIRLMKGITRRWLVNGMGIIFAILLVVWVFFVFFMRTYYYNNLAQNLTSMARIDSNNFTRQITQTNPDFYAAAKRSVEGFVDKSKLELMFLDEHGGVIITSSGFVPESGKPPKDFMLARYAKNGCGEWNGIDTQTGEKIMAVTAMLRDENGDVIGAARYVTSLSDVDMQVALYALMSGIICIAIVFIVIMSGIYFTNSIVIPVREVGAAARRVASGDFDARIEKQYDDEIGDLCDTINNMAGELGAAEKMKNDFISSVSHELRTPLTAIKGWGETILSSGPSDRETLSRGMKVIIEETERLSGMVEELLDFSRMQNGKLKMVIDKVDILAELDEAVIMFSDRAQREGVTLIYNEPAGLAPVMGDRNRLKQVFVNVFDNALKYSNPGGTITVNADTGEKSVSIKISDTGVGISKKDLPRVKEKFFKGNSMRRGSGIGLAVVDEIVSLHGGKFNIDSTEGKGTTVVITLPAIK